MKVTITQVEVQHYEITKQIELTEKEYAEYLSTSKVSQEIIDELGTLTDWMHHQYTNILSTELQEGWVGLPCRLMRLTDEA
jgi:hypothetical protein